MSEHLEGCPATWRPWRGRCECNLDGDDMRAILKNTRASWRDERKELTVALDQAQTEIDASKEVRASLIRRIEMLEQRIEQLESAGVTLRCADCGEEITDLQAHCESEDNACLIHDSVTKKECNHMWVDGTKAGEYGIVSLCLYCNELEPQSVPDSDGDRQ